MLRLLAATRRLPPPTPAHVSVFAAAPSRSLSILGKLQRRRRLRTHEPIEQTERRLDARAQPARRR
jgi:hypothetical protein